MKQLIFIYFFFTYIFGFSQLNFDKANQLLWEINRKDLKQPSYIYGTIHLNNPEVFKFSDSVYYALNQARYFASEVDIQQLFTTLNTPLNEKLLVSANGRIYSSSIFSTKNSYGSIKGWPQFLDSYLYQIAINSGKKMVALETIDDQLTAASSVTFSGYLKNTTLSEKELINVYLTGNLHSLQHIIYQDFKGTNGYSELITKRNQKMIVKIDSMIHLGSSFITVGAGHLAGKNGLLTLLYQKGYSVRPVESTFTNQLQTAKKFFSSHHFYNYKNTSPLFSIRFGMKPTFKIDEENVMYLESRDLGQGNLYLLEVEPLPSEKYNQENYLKENFYQPVNATLNHFQLADKSDVYEGIVSIEEYGLAWKRIVFHGGYLYKMTCSGSLPFLLSNRAKDFFNSLSF
jgi:uncharacterized protein YbaP (TraB family)